MRTSSVCATRAYSTVTAAVVAAAETAQQYVYVTAHDEVSSGAAGSRFVGSHARVVARVLAAHARYRQSAGIRVFCNLNA